MDELLRFRIPIEGLHTETGPGVFEAAILYSDALEAADRAVLFKASVKEIGHRFGILPTFMAKWTEKLPGSSGHMHQSLARGDKNAFYDERDPVKMSADFRHFTNNRRPLKSVADMKGLKIRVPNSKVAIDIVKALGASPVPG